MNWQSLLESLDAEKLVRIALLLFAGLPLSFIASGLARRFGKKRFSEQGRMLLGKAILYGGVSAVVLALMPEFGFRLNALLGAAGILGIALGFASQTSVSNVISGLFLIAERSFSVGDVIQANGQTGIVTSIDLLSAKIRTFDNRLIRLPNEMLIKTELINITRYPIRRMDLKLGVAYKEDIRKVREILTEIAADHPLCLDEPKPVFIFTNFGDSALEILFGVWFEKSDFLELKNTLMITIKERFDRENIEIPFPHRTLYTGSASPPMPVRVVSDPPTQSSPS